MMSVNGQSFLPCGNPYASERRFYVCKFSDIFHICRVVNPCGHSRVPDMTPCSQSPVKDIETLHFRRRLQIGTIDS